MTKHHSLPTGLQPSRLRTNRPWRSWLWRLSSSLRYGGIAVAFYLALRTGRVGTLALAAFVGGFLLGQVLEATSQGD